MSATESIPPSEPPVDLSLVISVPYWVDEVVAGFPGPLVTDESRMGLAVALSFANVERGGGPFGAAAFVGSRLVAAGVNRVLDTGFSIAHAEIVTLMRAQKRLTVDPLPAGQYTLVTSTEPCCQCFGALVWSGVEHLVCGATTADAEAIGFDEGPKPENWAGVLRRRGIQVELCVRRDEARAALQEYARGGGPIYGMTRPQRSVHGAGDIADEPG